MLLQQLSSHPHWSSVIHLGQELAKQGYRAVLAGGCVRDALLGRTPLDLDVATDATPDEVEKIFPKVVMVGKSFGVCRVVYPQSSGNPLVIEVATFREESDYRDGRHPQKIEFSTLEKDALRRDFTVNAMFYDFAKNQLLDYVGGEKDLQARVLRAVGDPLVRFSEDYLRLLRLARFAGQLEFSIEPTTLLAAQKLADKIVGISKERIKDEVDKAFKMKKPFLFFQALLQLGLTRPLFPDWSWDTTLLQKYFSQSWDSVEGWTVLLWLQKSLSLEKKKKFLGDMKFSGESRELILRTLSAEHDFLNNCDLKKFVELNRYSHCAAMKVFWLAMAKLQGGAEGVQRWQEKEAKYFVAGHLPQALVNGDDLLQRGVPAGQKIKELLDKAYLLQIESKTVSKDDLLKDVLKA